MTLPKSLTLACLLNWFTTPLGGGVLAILSAGCIALASQHFVTQEAIASSVMEPLKAEKTMNDAQGRQIDLLTQTSTALDKARLDSLERDKATQAANAERDKVIRALVETTQTLAIEVKAQGEKARSHEAQIIALQTATAGIRTEIAVVQTNQVAASRQADRIEDKLDRLIIGRSPK